LLRRRKVHLENAQVGILVAVAEGVQACREQHVLRNAVFDRCSKLIFRKAASGRHKGTKRTRNWMRFAFLIDCEFGSEQWNSDGIIQDARLIENLVRCPPMNHPKRSSAGATSLHKIESRAPRRSAQAG
jgi:hypothetical protein